MILPAHFYTGVYKNAKTKVSQSTVVVFFLFLKSAQDDLENVFISL